MGDTVEVFERTGTGSGHWVEQGTVSCVTAHAAYYDRNSHSRDRYKTAALSLKAQGAFSYRCGHGFNAHYRWRGLDSLLDGL